MLGGLRRTWSRQLSPTRRVAAWVLAVAGPTLLTLAALLLRSPLIRGGFLFCMLLVVIAVAVIGGTRPALAGIVLGALARRFFFAPPFEDLGVDLRPNLASLVGFAVAGTAVAILIGEFAQLADEQAALRRVATLVAGGVRPAEVFTAIADELGRLIGAEATFVSRIDHPSGERAEFSTVVGSYGPGSDQVPVGSRLDLLPGMIQTAAPHTGRPARLDRERPAKGPRDAWVATLGMRAAVATPIVVGGQHWGATVVVTSRRGFPAGSESRMVAFMELAATAIANADTERELRELADTQAALRRLATLVAQGEPPEAVFAAATKEVLRHFGSGTARMIRYELDGTATLLANEGTTGPHVRVGERWERYPTTGLTATVLRTGQAARIDDYRDIPGGEPYLSEGLGSAVAMPIHVNGRLWGMIAVGPGQGPLPRDAEQRMTEFTDLVATSVANAQNRGSLQASHDELARLLREQAALRRVATLVARGIRPVEIFWAVSEEVRCLIGADSAAIARFEPDGASVVVVGGVGGQVSDNLPAGSRVKLRDYMAPALVWRTGRAALVNEELWKSAPGRIAEGLRELGFRSMVASPIIVEGRLWGVVNALSKRGPFPSDAADRMADFTELVATAVGNAESRAELAASRTRIVAAADEARRRIERDLHDGAQQHLLALALRLHSATAVPHEIGDIRTEITHVAGALTSVIDELQEISRGIHPAVLSTAGLRPALRALGRRSTIPVDLDVRIDGRLPEAVEVGAYYVVSEMLTNAAKHASASVIEVNADASEGTLRVCVRDDGIGGADPKRGSGLVGLKDRIEALGGSFSLHSPPGGGTTVCCDLPVSAGDGQPDVDPDR
ncbi:sensor histidine kinase [Pseudonocardia sp. Cha107L01]|uniref:sensor histidine kinase n=1 Tax=Pseudonocardia sp. Cha107L01 TaxID=3457576 RepID=UPI00403E37E9